MVMPAGADHSYAVNLNLCYAYALLGLLAYLGHLRVSKLCVINAYWSQGTRQSCRKFRNKTVGLAPASFFSCF
jgi:hypothetical protein